LDYWTPYSDMRPRERNSKRSTYHQWSLPRGPRSHIENAPFLDTISLNFLMTLFAAWHASDLVPTPYKLKLCFRLAIPPLLVTCAMLMIFKMSNTSFFNAPIHTWSLSEGLMRPYFLPQASTMCLLFWARKTKLHFPLHALIVSN